MTAKEAFAQAEANARLEGLYPSEYAKGIFREVTEGKLSFDDAEICMIQRAREISRQEKAV